MQQSECACRPRPSCVTRKLMSIHSCLQLQPFINITTTSEHRAMSQVSAKPRADLEGDFRSDTPRVRNCAGNQSRAVCHVTSDERYLHSSVGGKMASDQLPPLTTHSYGEIRWQLHCTTTAAPNYLVLACVSVKDLGNLNVRVFRETSVVYLLTCVAVMS